MPAPPNSGGVLAAVRRLRPYIPVAPLYRSDSLSRGFDADVWLKVETASPIASFKLRGALNTLLINREFGKIRTAVTSSTGNHGQGVAYAARLLESPADIFLPDGANPVKQAMIRMFGGRLHLGGRDIDEAKDRARLFCEQNGGTFVDDGESGSLIEGAGTIGDEIARELESVDYVFVPMGSGSLASGVAIGLKAKQPSARVIAVQSVGAPAMVESFRAGRPVERPCNTIGDAIVCRVPAETALNALIQNLDDAALVTDRDLQSAMHTLLVWAHQLVEPGAAAGLAGAWQRRSILRGRRVVILLTGANVPSEVVAQALLVPPLFNPAV
ncbi:MAG TPA: pyridoxal-phosphate dependent enzyme [Dongiaceae bacterium]|jgi:threonine dehydratase